MKKALSVPLVVLIVTILFAIILILFIFQTNEWLNTAKEEVDSIPYVGNVVAEAQECFIDEISGVDNEDCSG